ncbi:MAG: hypothetical protein AB1796_02880 [Bacillota bacterium]
MIARKIGAIDLGSNSLRLLIALVEGQNLLYLRSELRETRLGEKLLPGGPLYPPARERTLAALSALLCIMKQEQVSEGEVVATSAVREAGDGTAFLSEAAGISPYPVRLLTEREEAYYGFKGAIKGTVTAASAENFLVLDFGGRSSEFSWQEQGVFRYCSLPLGAVSLTEAFYPGSRRTLEQLNSLQENVKRLMNLQKDLSAAATHRDLVGLGGTVTTLAMLALGLECFVPGCVDDLRLPKKDIDDLERVLRCSSPAQRAHLLPFAPQRAHIIVAGAAALSTLLEYLEKEYIRVSEQGLLHGLLNVKLY